MRTLLKTFSLHQQHNLNDGARPSLGQTSLHHGDPAQASEPSPLQNLPFSFSTQRSEVHPADPALPGLSFYFSIQRANIFRVKLTSITLIQKSPFSLSIWLTP